MNRTKAMKTRCLNNRSKRLNRPGIVLLVTLVILVILSAMVFTLTSRLAVQRHRQQYIIDYQAARYACDSAARYIFANLQDINTPPLIDRPNEPDFSDLFNLSEAEYKEFLANWLAENVAGTKNSADIDIRDVNDINDINDVNNVSTSTTSKPLAAKRPAKTYNIADAVDFNNINSLVVPGPYGPSWPLIIEPLELKIGSATVKVEIEDEDAKYPIGWALLENKEVQREASAGLKTFCEWMDVNDAQIDSLKQQLKEISKIKTFKLDFQPTTITERKETQTQPAADRGGRSRGGVSRTRLRSIRKVTIPPSAHIADFAQLFHSSLIDTETLARPTVVSENRKESALKYIGLWASSKVNINTAPRQVLEAAFTFGGDADKIAEEIIQRRQIKPFKDIEDLKKTLFKYSDSIGKCEKYITTNSRFFTVKITAVSGVAQASTVFAIIKDGKKIEKIAVISG